MDILCIVFGVPVLALGIAFWKGRALNYSHAWRTMPEEDKAAINMDRINKNLGIAVLACAVILLACGLFSGIRVALGPLFTVWAVAVLIDAVYISRSKRYIKSNAQALCRDANAFEGDTTRAR
ncbi:MAG: DUF3784 domain-containing protein [Eggerthellaceae bacterium]|nr:DUF3784 domain-containing protein [Eggerthellaceae bacterium]